MKLAKEEANAEIKMFIEEAENEFKLHKENVSLKVLQLGYFTYAEIFLKQIQYIDCFQ